VEDIGLQGEDMYGEIVRSDNDELRESERLRVDAVVVGDLVFVTGPSSLVLFLCLFRWFFSQIQTPSSLCPRPSVPKI
jgi:hypothetical protein